MKFFKFFKGGQGSRSNTVFKNMALIATGEGVGKVIGIISLPLITRIYSPEDIGILTLYNSVIMILLPFGTLKYSDAIILPKTEGLALNLSMLCFLINLLFSFFTFISFYFFGNGLLNLFGFGTIASYWWLIGISIFLINSYEILYNWNLRRDNFRLMAKTKSLQNVFGESAKIIIGYMGVKPLGLLLGAVIGRSSGIFSLLTQYKLDWFSNKKQLLFKRIRILFLFYKDFPLYRLTSYFLFVSSTQVIPVIITSLFGSSSAGQVGLAMTVIGLPITLIGNSVGQAYYNEISKIKNYRNNELYEITKSVAKKLVMLGIVPFSVVLLLSKPIFVLCFGVKWGEAGEFCSILSFYLMTQFIAAPLMNALIVLKRQRATLFIHGFRLSSILVIYYISNILKFDIKTFLLVYSLFLSLHYIFVVLRLFNLIKNERFKGIS